MVEAYEIHSKIIGNHRTSQEGLGKPRKSDFPSRILVRRYFLGLSRTSQDLLGLRRKAWEGTGRLIFLIEAQEIHSKIIGNHRTSYEGLGKPRKSYYLSRILVRLDFLGFPRTSLDFIGKHGKAQEGFFSQQKLRKFIVKSYEIIGHLRKAQGRVGSHIFLVESSKI